MTILGRISTPSRPVRTETFVRAALTSLVALAAIVFAFVVTQQLDDRSPVVAVALGALAVLPAWMFFSRDYAATLAVYLLYLGLLDGVLKLKLDTEVATLGRDLLLYSIVAGALARIAVDARPVRLPPLTAYVVLFVAIVAAAVFNPGTGGIGRGLAAARPHVEFIPLFFLGYAVMRDKKRLRIYLLILCVVAAANGVVSLVQFNLTPTELASWGPGYEDNIYGTSAVSGRTSYDERTGTEYVRPFGLGADTGAGGMVGALAVPALLALLATRRRITGWVIAPLAAGILLAVATSQARIAVICAVVALLAFAALAVTSRRRANALAVVAGMVALAFVLASVLSGSDNSAAFGRYDSIAPDRILETTFSYRSDTLKAIPDYAWDAPLGRGLGLVGPGASYAPEQIPASSRGLNGESEFTYLLIELGVAGMLVFGALQIRLLALSTRLRRIRDTETRLLLAGCAAPLFALASAWLIGPVSSNAPTAPFLWFTAGLLAFWLMRARDESREPTPSKPVIV